MFFHVLGFFFIILIAILLIGLSIIGTVIRSLFGIGNRRTGNSHSSDKAHTSNGPSASATGAGTYQRPKRRKLFTQDDGEYVDFEEVKE